MIFTPEEIEDIKVALDIASIYVQRQAEFYDLKIKIKELQVEAGNQNVVLEIEK